MVRECEQWREVSWGQKILICVHVVLLCLWTFFLSGFQWQHNGPCSWGAWLGGPVFDGTHSSLGLLVLQSICPGLMGGASALEVSPAEHTDEETTW